MFPSAGRYLRVRCSVLLLRQHRQRLFRHRREIHVIGCDGRPRPHQDPPQSLREVNVTHQYPSPGGDLSQQPYAAVQGNVEFRSFYRSAAQNGVISGNNVSGNNVSGQFCVTWIGHPKFSPFNQTAFITLSFELTHSDL